MDQRESVSKTTNFYYFKNANFKVALNALGVDWIGRHYVISTTQKSRVYTNCTMLSKEVDQYRKGLLKVLDRELEGQETQVGEQEL